MVVGQTPSWFAARVRVMFLERAIGGAVATTAAARIGYHCCH